jgi:hypothetical protein
MFFYNLILIFISCNIARGCQLVIFMTVPLTPRQTNNMTLPVKSSIALLVKYLLGRTYLCERAAHHHKGDAWQFQAQDKWCGDLSLPTLGERVTCEHVAHSTGITLKCDLVPRCD